MRMYLIVLGPDSVLEGLCAVVECSGLHYCILDAKMPE